MRAKVMAAAALLIVAGTVQGQVVDGVVSPGDGYGAALAVQTVQTGFGDNQSELNAAYARITGGRLYLALTGNLETNFNRLNIFIDSGLPGGQNVINGAMNPTNDGWAGKHHGLTFDAGFSPNYMLIMRQGGAPTQFMVDYAIIGGAANDGGLVGMFNPLLGPASISSNIGAAGLVAMDVAMNNTNVAGITGGSGPANQAAALAVTTGLEFSIPLAAIGNPIGEIRISAMINGANHDYLSNQILSGLMPPQGNLGGDGQGGFTGTLGGINFNNFAGQQFFTVVPAPSAGALLALGAFCVARRRR
jgi:hypothetical protein